MKLLLIQIREQPWKLLWDSRSFKRSLKLPQKSLKILNAFNKKLTPDDFEGFDAVIIGGSKYDVDDAIPNKKLLRDFIKKSANNGLPLLGVCFGAQLIADTLQGQAGEDEKNQEFGTFVMEKTRAGGLDPLLRGMPKKFLAQCAHHDRIFKLPPTAVLLARSRKCQVQAFKIRGTSIYGVQFHPERSREAYMEGLVYELERLPKEQREITNLPLKKIMRALKQTSTEKILKNFLKIARV